MLRGFLTAVVMLLVLPLTFCVAMPMAVTYEWGWSRSHIYNELDHPAHTERLFFDYRTGHNTYSNSNDCDFIVFEARSYSPAAKEKIRAFYEGKKIRINKDYDKYIGFVFLDEIGTLFSHNDIYSSWIKGVEKQYNMPFYILYDSLDGPENGLPFLDLRCA